ncbi:endonuclease/exonuclease/phosphatase family protein [Actinomadura oligospora]|uniref:endonuclease/exonuclease/phosphatase family protein n=1 Tax=Actinomadura oligospora TaxID=111804 RepID=UPI000478EF30|nr:endonuclease/exonuclease/phosphatase family protein [Actinomadura oligospora]
MSDVLRITTWNLNNGGTDGADDSRLWGILDRISASGPHDVVFLQECKWGDSASRRLHQVAQHLNMPGGRYLVPAPRYGCDLVALVRETSTLRVVQERHETGLTPWFHALLRLEVAVGAATGTPRRVDLCGVHLAPSSPRIRATEADMFNLISKVEAIAAGDFNARALSERDLPEDTDLSNAKILRKLDTTPAQVIAAAGFADLGEMAGDLTPTVGFGIGPVPHRADRIYTNIKGVQVLEHAVLSADDGDRRLSDHDGVTTLIRIPV